MKIYKFVNKHYIPDYQMIPDEAFDDVVLETIDEMKPSGWELLQVFEPRNGFIKMLFWKYEL